MSVVWQSFFTSSIVLPGEIQPHPIDGGPISQSLTVICKHLNEKKVKVLVTYVAESWGDFFIDWTYVVFVKFNYFSNLLGVDTEVLVDDNE